MNQGFGDCFSYKRLNVVINDSDFIILGLNLLIYSSDVSFAINNGWNWMGGFGRAHQGPWATSFNREGNA